MSNPQQPSASGDLADVKNGPLAKAGQALIGLYLDYQEYVKAGESGPFASPQSAPLLIEGTRVGVTIRGADLDDLMATLGQLGMEIKATAPHPVAVEGLLPISQLLTVAQSPKIDSLTPIYRPSHSERMG